MSDRLRLALVGCGSIAEFHLQGADELSGKVAVTALVDPELERAERFAERTGGRAFRSLTEAIAGGGFDAVDIMVPHHLHEPLALEAFAAGKHVLLEKPISTSLDSCNRILAAAAEAGVVFSVAENGEFWPELVRAKELIDSGAIGEVVTARANFIYDYDPQWFRVENPWRLDAGKTGGGIVIDGSSHWIRPLRNWMGEVESVTAVIGHPFERMQGESQCQAIFRFESGKTAVFEALNIDSVLGPQDWWRIVGRKGEIAIGDGFEGQLRLFDERSPEGRSVMDASGYAGAFAREIEDFADAVLTGTPLQAGPEQSLAEFKIAQAIYESARTGGWVRPAEIT